MRDGFVAQLGGTQREQFGGIDGCLHLSHPQLGVEVVGGALGTALVPQPRSRPHELDGVVERVTGDSHEHARVNRLVVQRGDRAAPAALGVRAAEAQLVGDPHVVELGRAAGSGALAESSPVVVDRHSFGVGGREEHPHLVGVGDAAGSECDVSGQAAGAVELPAVQPPARHRPGSRWC